MGQKIQYTDAILINELVNPNLIIYNVTSVKVLNLWSQSWLCRYLVLQGTAVIAMCIVGQKQLQHHD